MRNLTLSQPIQLTHEQYAPIESAARKIVVKALAGSGKSTLLKAYAHFKPDERIIYLVFNTDNASQAKLSFPKSNVYVSTTHALAFKTVGVHYQRAGKLGFLSATALKQTLNINDWAFVKLISETINNFTFSVDTVISANNLPASIDAFYSNKTSMIIEYAQRAWKHIIDLDHPLKCSHDAYLKIWALGQPVLDYDTIMFDEGQDSNNLIMSVISKQKAKLIMVGDRNQQIYSFRGSVNALEHPFLRDAEQYALTQSFRFGSDIAKLANIILGMAGETLRVKGLDAIKSSIMTHDDNEPGHHGQPYQKAYISRTVFGTIEVALSLLEHKKKTYWGGKIASYNLDELINLYHFSINAFDKVKDQKLLKDFGTFTNYKDISKRLNDSEMARSIKIVETYGANLPTKIEQLKMAATDHQSEAAFVVTTAHRSKGLEFECVTLMDDFTNPYTTLEDAKKRNGFVINAKMKEQFVSEMSLLYVAVTRTIYRLNINSVIKELISLAKAKAVKN